MSDGERDPLVDLDELARRIDERFAEIQSRRGASMECRAGCSDCCRARLSITRVEEARLRRYLAERPTAERQELARRARDPAREMCPALDGERRCGIYPARPLICRSFGVPLRRRREVVLVNPPVIDVCDLNFVEISLERLPSEDVMEQTQLDAELASIDLEFCEGHDLPLGERVGIAQILASSE